MCFVRARGVANSALRCARPRQFERREFLAPADGGGGQGGIDVSAGTLSAHRTARRLAERAGTGRPTTVRYTDIPFEELTTSDVMEAVIRPVRLMTDL